MKRLVDMGRQYWSNAQYSRGECLEVVGIPDSFQNNELEDKVLTIFKKIGCEVSVRDIEACHCLKKDNERLIFKFSRLKDCEQVIFVKKDLKHLKMQEIELPGNRLIFITAIFINELGKSSNFYICSGTIKVETTENKNPISITQNQDFIKHFAEVDILPTSEYSYCSKFVLM